MNILLGISSSISAYKTPELVRRFIKKGYKVQTVLTKRAAQFVAPLSLKTVSEHPVYLQKTPFDSAVISHLEMARNTDVYVIAPASANVMAKLANGIADDLLTTSFLAYEGPKLICPAMHTEMWNNPITQRNCEILKQNGCMILAPESGELSCKDVGQGRLADLDWIVEAAHWSVLAPISLKGKRIVVTAGGTQEKLDDVRIISNLSTGKSGTYLARMAAFYEADVTLISTVTDSDESLFGVPNMLVKPVKSVSEMAAAVEAACAQATHLIMAAAVSDYTPKPSVSKIKRHEKISIELTATTDILASVKTANPALSTVGYCLESEDVLVAEAIRKRREKKCDLMIANTAAAIGADTRSVVIIDRTDTATTLASKTLAELSHNILSRL